MMSSAGQWALRIDPSVAKTLQKIPHHDVESILVAFRLLSVNPYFGDVQKMKGGLDVWRRRVGAYRIFYRLMTHRNILLVFHVERRSSKTYSR